MIQRESMSDDQTAARPRRAATIILSIVLGSLAYFLQAHLVGWIFDGPNWSRAPIYALGFGNCLALGTLAWGCVQVLHYVPEGTRLATLPWRMAIGALAFLSGSLLAFGLFYRWLFPLLVGRECQNQFYFWATWATAGLVVHLWLLMHDDAAKDRRHALHMQLETDLLATALDRADLAMLEAQIEPHFLFNTLAHIKREYRLDGAAAGDLLAALIDYLDRATPALRRADWTVGDELGLIDVYLSIIERRLGTRLAFSITGCARSRAAPLPALTIATLVENAVRHGLAPKADGGHVRVIATMDDAHLLIAVHDDGVGLCHSSGTGLGLATVRARLHSTFGALARLTVEPLASGGVQASVRIAGST